MKAKTLSQSLQCVLTLSLAIASVFGLASCTSDEYSTPATATEMHLYVNGDLYNIALPATEAVNLATLGTEFDTEEECLAYENTIKQIGSAARFFNDKLTREMTTVEEISQYGIFAYILDAKKAEAERIRAAEREAIERARAEMEKK